jgi:peptide-methionine (S)-S-oxide reductase
VYERVRGVKSVISGYAGGFVPRPTYQQVLTGQTGHAEVVQIEFDPRVVTYDQLLEIFWRCHDPTTLNRQGPDVGTQYRSIILFENDAQRQAAETAIAKLSASRKFYGPIVTEVVPLQAFYPAEEYHQDYYRKHPNAPYCRVYIAPKLRKLRGK